MEIIQERDGCGDGIYLDLKKALDKVSYKRLSWKLEGIRGVQGKLLKWMEDFLVGGEMRTVIRDQPSEWSIVTTRMPRGSMLVPVMFTVIINDMAENITSYVNLFADDAKLLHV